MDDGEGKDESGMMRKPEYENWWERLPDDYFDLLAERGDGKNVTVKCSYVGQSKVVEHRKNSTSKLEETCSG